jgi:tetratricopeptide (TPR) repeat protein
VARKGTRQLNEGGAGPASLAWREAVAKSREDAGEAWAPDEVWVRESTEPATKKPTRRSTGEPSEVARPGRKPRTLPAEVNSELADQVSGAKVVRLQQRLNDAAGAYERDRYGDAARILKPLAEQAPGAAAVRELYGLALYRLGRWDAAIKELEAFRALSDSVDQLPTLADCYRAKKRWKDVEALWEELRKESPGPELLAEGRLVYAGSLADRGKLAEAITILEQAKTDQKKPKADHLRTWYALGDLYERAGEVPRARELFRRVLRFDAELYDTADRLHAIGG